MFSHVESSKLSISLCSRKSAPLISSSSLIRTGESLFITTNRKRVVDIAQAEQLRATAIWTPSNFHRLSLRTSSSMRVCFKRSFSINGATAIRLQTPQKKWTGTQPTGSSILSLSSKRHPMHAMKPPTAPITKACHGLTTVHIANKKEATNYFKEL